MAKKKPTKPTKSHSAKSKARKSPKIEDLAVNKTSAEDVIGGLSFTYGEIKPTYTPQKPDGS
jgi:hypothetical protein